MDEPGAGLVPGSGPRRIALVVAKALSPGAAANVSALLMGQLARTNASIYAPEPVVAPDGIEHVAIRHSTVILRAGPGQLKTLAAQLRELGLSSCVFSALGQALNNQFDEYRRQLQSSGDVELVGVGVYASDERVRDVTKKFSLLQ